MQKTHVIIGTSAAGIGAITTLKRIDPESEIIIITAQAEFPYNKCFLADYLAQKKDEQQLCIKNAEFFEQPGITLLNNSTVTSIDSSHNTITLADGKVITFDTLLLAVGTRPIIPPFCKGISARGLFTFHTLSDANGIMQYLQDTHVRDVVVIGAGLSGLECADALRARVQNIAVVEFNNQVLPHLVDQEGSALIESAMHNAGVALHKNSRVQSIGLHSGAVTQVVLQDGATIPAQLVVIATGAVANLELAQSAGIATRNGGIVTDKQMRSSVSTIFAAGDCALVQDQISGEFVRSCLWPDAMMQGMVAVHAMAGIAKEYPGAIMICSSAFYDIQFVSAGACKPTYAVTIKRGQGYYHNYYHENAVLKGFLMVGAIHNLPQLRRLLLTKEVIDPAML